MHSGWSPSGEVQILKLQTVIDDKDPSGTVSVILAVVI